MNEKNSLKKERFVEPLFRKKEKANIQKRGVRVIIVCFIKRKKESINAFNFREIFGEKRKRGR